MTKSLKAVNIISTNKWVQERQLTVSFDRFGTTSFAIVSRLIENVGKKRQGNNFVSENHLNDILAADCQFRTCSHHQKKL